MQQDISGSQRDRLAHIDLRLRFLGDVGRNDLVARFGIQAAAATRDLALYGKLAPDNIVYDQRLRRYVQGSSFKPLFDISPSRIVEWLMRGFGDGVAGADAQVIPGETTFPPGVPNLEMLAATTRAIHGSKALDIDYLSISGGKSRRRIIPFAIFDGGLRLYARALDSKTGEYRDFAIPRILGAADAGMADPGTEAVMARDIHWSRIIEAELVPHPDRPRPEVTELDFGMRQGEPLRVRLRAAVAGYALRRWEVDCSPDHSLTDPGIRLWLKDHLVLYGAENAGLAPGYPTGGRGET